MKLRLINVVDVTINVKIILTSNANINIIDEHLKLNNHYYFKMKNITMTSSLMLKYYIVRVNPR